jgi:hypothetical protein
MQKRFNNVINNLISKGKERFRKEQENFQQLIEDKTGLSIVDIVVQILAALAVGAIVILALKAWAPTFFQNVLNQVTTTLLP